MGEPSSAALLALLEHQAPPAAFAAVVGNPPYQVSTGKSVQVYGTFYLLYSGVAETLTFIFPRGWQTSSPQGPNSKSFQQLLHDPHLLLVDDYLELPSSPVQVFPEVATGGVSIVLRSASKTVAMPLVSTHGAKPETKALHGASSWRPLTATIIEKLSKWMEEQELEGMHKLVTSRGFGVDTFVTTDATREDYSYVTEVDAPGTVRLWSRSIGKQEYSWHGLRKTYPLLKLRQAETYKVIWVKMAGATNWRKTKVLQPGEIYSFTFIGAYFDSLEETESFRSYFSTLFYRFLLSETVTTWSAMPHSHRFVPNLATVKQPLSGELGWRATWSDEALKELLATVLTAEEWAHIEATALTSDPAGAKA